MRYTTADDDSMDQVLLFLSSLGLLQQMASMDHFLLPSLTIMRCAAADGDSMDQFLVSSTSMRSITGDGDGMDQFLVLRITFISVKVPLVHLSL